MGVTDLHCLLIGDSGLINENPVNAYEITKTLDFMNVKWWFNIADSTVYATIRNCEKKELITGTIEKIGNMPERTIYRLTEKGYSEFLSTLRQSFLQFDYDTNIFSIAAFFIDALPVADRGELLNRRIEVLERYLVGINRAVEKMDNAVMPISHTANVKRMVEIVKAEILGAQELLKVFERWNNEKTQCNHE